MCLKAPPSLWAAIFYLSRGITLPIAMAFAHAAGVDDLAISKFHAFWSVYELLPSLIAALVLVTLFRRVPAAGNWMRWTWARGRILLSVAAALDAALLICAGGLHGGIGYPSPVSMAAVAVDVGCLVYILSAQRVRHVFADFPFASA
jgi:hypothetical protein